MQTLCVACLAGYPFECHTPDSNGYSCEYQDHPVGNPKKESGGQEKSRDKIKDLKSTGRKQAAKKYPIEEGMICEWSGLKNCGGGVQPINGCNGNFATNRHHGPDKNTLNNELSNLHRICATCHNTWHARNDVFYPKERPAGDIPYVPIVPYFEHDRVTKLKVELTSN